MGRAASRAAAMHQISAVRAARPTTGPALPVPQILATPVDALAPGLRFLGGLDPADPLVAGERRDVVPSRQRLWVSQERIPEVVRKAMDNAAGNFPLIGHYIRPIARKLDWPCVPTITWSWTATFMCRPASTSSRVSLMSAWLGVGSPLG